MNQRINKVALLPMLGMAALLVSASCATTPPVSVSNSATKVENANLPSDRGDQVVTGADLPFMNDAAQGNMVEVELGRLAAERASSKEVKQFGQRMVDDHSKANQELMQLAGNKKVTLPPQITPKQKETLEKLSKLNGADFDRAYVKEMVADHEQDVAAYDGVANNATDKDVKALAAKTLPTLKEHLQMIREIAGKMDGQTRP